MTKFIKLHGLDLEPFLLNVKDIEYVECSKGGNTAIFGKGDEEKAYLCVETIDEVLALINA